MSKNIEYEERIMLTKKDYFLLLKHYKKECSKNTKFNITNYYFDTDQLDLLNNHSVLRLRFINNRPLEITLKQKQKEGDIEINEPINKKQSYSILKNDFSSINEIKQDAFKNVKIITKLSTKRYEFKYDNYLVVIDKNRYNKITDYDLEIESTSKEKSLAIILQIAKQFNLKYDPNYISKSRRAFNSVKPCL